MPRENMPGRMNRRMPSRTPRTPRRTPMCLTHESCIPLCRSAVVSILAIAAVMTAPATFAQTAADGVYAVTYLDVGTTSVAQGIDLRSEERRVGKEGRRAWAT